MLEDPARAEVLRHGYGIFPAFSGLGFSVKGSGAGAAMSGADVLRRSVTPEYEASADQMLASGMFERYPRLKCAVRKVLGLNAQRFYRLAG